MRFEDRVEIFTQALLEWSKIHNLTGGKDINSINSNIIDSIEPLDKIESFSRVLDIGSGAGFPGLIIAMKYPDIDVTLVEPRVKRVSFLNLMRLKLKLDRVKVIQKRVEDFSDESYDLITSRAVTNTKLLYDLSKHLSTNSTKYLFYKGSSVDKEIDNIKDYKIFHNDKTQRNYLYIKEF
jgi:16S rRNA (guanine527-N7)-methyltransferase